MKNFTKALLFLLFMCIAFYRTEQRYHFIDTISDRSMDEEAVNEYVKSLWEGMLQGEEQIVLTYVGPSEKVEDFVTDALEKAFAIDEKDTSSDYDYMRFKHTATYMDMRGYGRKYTVTYKMEYLETKEQTDAVDKKIKEVFEKLKIEKKNDYNKIKTIHDYIINHANYDLSTEKNSAYAALLQASSACQGYASLTYKMMTEAGIPCRIISGAAKGVPHAWNLVKLDGSWYNLDCTWDDPVGLIGDSKVRYQYFLKSDLDFPEHVRDEEYKEIQFTDQYPMAKVSYAK